MKDYLVTNNGDWLNAFIVSANNQKEAIKKVFDSIFKPNNASLREKNRELGYCSNHIWKKSDFKAHSLPSLYKEGDIIIVN